MRCVFRRHLKSSLESSLESCLRLFPPSADRHCKLSTAHCPLSTAHCPLSTVHCKLFIAHCLLLRRTGIFHSFIFHFKLFIPISSSPSTIPASIPSSVLSSLPAFSPKARSPGRRWSEPEQWRFVLRKEEVIHYII